MGLLNPAVLNIGAGGLVVLFIILIGLGLLVPARTVRARERDWKTQLDEANARAREAQEHAEAWREQTQGLMALSARRSDETEKLLETSKVSEGLLRAVNQQLQITRGVS